MKARVEHRWPRDVVAVWLYRTTTTGYAEVLELGRPAEEPDTFSAAASWRRLRPEDPPGPPTLELPLEALEALAEAASELRPPSTEQAAALADTRATRDRLLSLVEGLVLPPASAGATPTLRPA